MEQTHLINCHADVEITIRADRSIHTFQTKTSSRSIAITSWRHHWTITVHGSRASVDTLIQRRTNGRRGRHQRDDDEPSSAHCRQLSVDHAAPTSPDNEHLFTKTWQKCPNERQNDHPVDIQSTQPIAKSPAAFVRYRRYVDNVSDTCSASHVRHSTEINVDLSEMILLAAPKCQPFFLLFPTQQSVELILIRFNCIFHNKVRRTKT